MWLYFIAILITAQVAQWYRWELLAMPLYSANAVKVRYTTLVTGSLQGGHGCVYTYIVTMDASFLRCALLGIGTYVYNYKKLSLLF